MEWMKTIYQKKISTPLLRVLKKAGITANQVTLINHIMTLTVVVWLFSRGNYWANIAGCLVMGINVVLDFADGDLARSSKTNSAVGTWIDSVFDVIIQNAVMASIAVGCHKEGMPFIISMWFFIGNAGSNLVSFHYNKEFGFDSYCGSAAFREYMNRCGRWAINKPLKNIIDPTASFAGLFLYTVRYWVLLGAVLGIMPIIFMAITIIVNIRWLIMYALFGLYLNGNKGLSVLRVLNKMGEDNAI